MIELIMLRPGAPDIYQDYAPDDPASVRLHHHGFRVADAAAWGEINRRVAGTGFVTPRKGADGWPAQLPLRRHARGDRGLQRICLSDWRGDVALRRRPPGLRRKAAWLRPKPRTSTPDTRRS